jgi:hypothetical protein
LGKALNTRYITAFLVPASIFSSQAILSFKKKFTAPIGILTALPAIAMTTLLIFSPLSYFNILDKVTTSSQKSEYVTDWTSGYGIPEVVSYLQSQSKNNPIIVGVRVDAGNPESAMFAYFEGSDNVVPQYIDPKFNPGILNYKCIQSQVPVYFVARDGILNGLNKFFVEQKRFYKPEGTHFISVLLLKPCN